MSAPTITVDISGGQAIVSTAGFQGKACETETAQLEKALGVKTANRRTPEWDVKEVRTIGS